MKNKLFILFVILTNTILFISCGKQSSQKKDETIIEPVKKSFWTNSLKKKFIISNSQTDFDRFALTKLIKDNEFVETPEQIKKYIISEGFDKYKESIKKSYTVTIDNLAGKSKKEIEKILGKPNNKDRVSPSGTPCPCDKYNYIYDLIEIVFINGKADWITVNNRSEYILISKPENYASANWFSDYAYVKVFTK